MDTDWDTQRHIDTERRGHTETQIQRDGDIKGHRYRETGTSRDTWTQTDMDIQIT